MELKKNEGYVWHEFHNQLLTYCFDFAYRIETIEHNKPASEKPTRLKLFRFVKGELPAAFVKTRDRHIISGLVLLVHNEEIEALHKKECKHCTWNGEELVFPRNWYQRIRARFGYWKESI